MKKQKKIFVDMSATIIHHGHIRILKKASKYGQVIVGLTKDKDLIKYKMINPEIKFINRAEILESVSGIRRLPRV